MTIVLYCKYEIVFCLKNGISDFSSQIHAKVVGVPRSGIVKMSPF